MKIGIIAFTLDSWGLSPRDLIKYFQNEKSIQLFVNTELWNGQQDFFKAYPQSIIHASNRNLLNETDRIIVFDKFVFQELQHSKFSDKIFFCPDSHFSGNFSLLRGEWENLYSVLPHDQWKNKVLSFFLEQYQFSNEKNDFHFDLAFYSAKDWCFDFSCFETKKSILLLGEYNDSEIKNVASSVSNELKVFYAPISTERDFSFLIKKSKGLIISLPSWNIENESERFLEILKQCQWGGIPLLSYLTPHYASWISSLTSFENFLEDESFKIPAVNFLQKIMR